MENSDPIALGSGSGEAKSEPMVLVCGSGEDAENIELTVLGSGSGAENIRRNTAMKTATAEGGLRTKGLSLMGMQPGRHPAAARAPPACPTRGFRASLPARKSRNVCHRTRRARRRRRSALEAEA